MSVKPTIVELILNAPAAGKSMLLAVSAAAQKVLLSLGNVDNTSDAAKPVSTAQQTALDLKAPIASPTFTGIPAAPTASGGTNTTQIASTAFVTAAVASAVTGLLEFQGNIDCSANPNYPAGSKGDTYYVSVAGKIGGASGVTVAVGDAIVCKADNAGGPEASVGTSWFALEKNLAGALLSANNLSDVANAATARTNLGLGTLATQSGTFSGTHSGTSSNTNTGDQFLFSTIAVSGQSSVVADATSDTLTLIAGTNVTITTNATNDEVTITASGGSTFPSGSTGQVQYNNSGAFGGFAGLTVSGSSPNVVVTAQGAAHIPLVIKGAASQSASHLSFQTSSGSEYLSIDVTTTTPVIKANSGFSIEAALRGYAWLVQDVSATNYAAFATVFGFNQFSLASTTRLTWSSGTNARNAGDTGLVRASAGVLEINSGTVGTLRDLSCRNSTMSGTTTLGQYTVATLPSASANTRAAAFVTDANMTFTLGAGTIVASGGSNVVPVYSDGTNWRIG
jgi:hypothetical protein